MEIKINCEKCERPIQWLVLLYEIKALLGMLARLPWGRRDVLGSMNGKYEGVR